MSYDLDIVVDHNDGYKTNVFEGSPTYNLRPMLVAAGLPDSLHTLHGMTAADAEPLVFAVWRELRTKPDHYRTFDSSNGWGTYKDLLPWVKDLYLTCRLHPRGVIKVA